MTFIHIKFWKYNNFLEKTQTFYYESSLSERIVFENNFKSAIKDTNS